MTRKTSKTEIPLPTCSIVDIYKGPHIVLKHLFVLFHIREECYSPEPKGRKRQARAGGFICDTVKGLE